MKGFKRRGIGLAAGLLALALVAPAAAQENLDSGKTGAQLYAADCAICHKSAQALKKSGGIFGLSSFLREHYTASRESAAAIASYLDSVAAPPAQKKPAGATKRTAKGDEKAKADEKKAKPKSGDAKSEKPDKKDKPSEAKTSEPKSESKSEPKGEAKPSELKSDAAKPSGSRAARTSRSAASRPRRTRPPHWKPPKPSSSRRRSRLCARPMSRRRKPRLQRSLTRIRTNPPKRRRAKRRIPRAPKARSDQRPALRLLVGFLWLVRFGGGRSGRF
jgi:hypothetical protein